MKTLEPIPVGHPGFGRLRSHHPASHLLDDTLHCIAYVGVPCAVSPRSASGLRSTYRDRLLVCMLIWAGAAAAEGRAESSQLAFAANVGAGNWDLVVGGPAGGAAVPLTHTDWDESDPRWSPDRRAIVYAGSDGRLYKVDVKTRQVQEVAPEDPSMQKSGPCFSPDGTRVVYSRRNSNSPDDADLAVYDLRTRTSRTLIRQYGPQFDPDWSADGRAVVYVSIHCSADCGRVIQELWVASGEGGYARQLLMTNAMCSRPRWSPDSRRIAFSSDRSGNFDIWILSVEDASLRQVTVDPHLDTSPAWSPDSKRLAFISARTGKMKVWLVDLGTGAQWTPWPAGDVEMECRDVAW
jgi:TolB protein